MSGKLTHLDDKGQARMVDVAGKDVTTRTAVAKGRITLSAEALALVLDGKATKGDVFAAARIAGIMAAKKTAELIPLCHPLALSSVSIDFAPEDAREDARENSGIEITATVKVSGQTGVEMEALTAVSVAALTIYDMVKAVDKRMTIGDIRLVAKEGGRSGSFTAE